MLTEVRVVYIPNIVLMLTAIGKSIKLQKSPLAWMASRTYIHCASLKENEAANQLCRFLLPLPHAA